MNCVDIKHNRLGECGNRKVQCIICVDVYKAENHKYGIISYITKIVKIYTYVIPKYVNCEENYQALIFKCPARLKTQIEKQKKKMKKSQLSKKRPITNKSPNKRPVLR